MSASPRAAQEAWTGEVGARGHRGPFTYDVTLYRAHLDTRCCSSRSTASTRPPPSTPTRPSTRGSRRRWTGAGPALAPAPDLDLSDFRFDGDAQYGDNRLPIVPKHFYRAEAALRRPGAAGSWPRRWSGRLRPVDRLQEHQKAPPSYAILNLNAGWTVNDKVSLFLDARNLADEAYISNVQAATTWLR
jgi:iron complex outermembrane receptor protein